MPQNQEKEFKHIGELCHLTKFKVKKPAKNQETKMLVDKLSRVSGWSTQAIYFQVPHIKLQEAINYCIHYTTPQARNAKLREFVNNLKK